MADLVDFLKTVLSHWGWLTGALVAFSLSGLLSFIESYRAKLVLIVIGIGCLVIAVYLTLAEQYTALDRYLRSN
jgi:hypothetical protein